MRKVLAREAGRWRLFSGCGKKRGTAGFLHYPRVFGQEKSNRPILEVLLEYQIRRVYYGHIHGSGCSHALNGFYQGIAFRLVSSDFLRFVP